MPELPEVETVVRAIRPQLVHRTILKSRFTVPRQLQPQRPAAVARALAGLCIAAVSRRGKYILIESPDRGTLLLHLGMTGRLYVRRADAHVNAHERAWFTLDNGKQLIFHDPRTLGVIRFFAHGKPITPVVKLGWEPLEHDVDAEALRAKLATRSVAIKPLLLNQTVWAGIGNIYASEALWEAGIHPDKPAFRLTPAECQRICHTVPAVLRRALEQGGSSIRDFMSPAGEAGEYQKQFRVYGRAGEPCFRCGREIVRIVQAARSTYFCPGCQKKKC